MKRVVLCRPEGPRNLGAILRVAQNFGPTELWLVDPQRPSILVHPEFEQMSHGAEDAREGIVVVDTLTEALAECTHAVGFSARVRGNRRRVDWRRAAPEQVAWATDDAQRLALVFGNEVSGLTAAECDLCHELVHVRTSVKHTSLNLAMAVGIVLSDLYTGTRVHQKEPGGSLLDGAGREFLKARLQEVFAAGVARTPAARRDIAAMIERVFSRAPLENRDARALHLILKTLGSGMAPTDLGLTLHHKGGRRRKAIDRRAERDSVAQGDERGDDAPPMVHLNRIYTRTGDDGSTALGDGSRVPKHDLRIEAYGTVDEVSALLGLVRAHGIEEPYAPWMAQVQNDLCDLASDLCRPGAAEGGKDEARIPPEYATRLEGWIDEVNEGLEPLRSFLLPGGRPVAAWLHLARTVCRRAERLACALAAREGEVVGEEVLRYLNRLSDLLFVVARAANEGVEGDLLWKPGGEQE